MMVIAMDPAPAAVVIVEANPGAAFYSSSA